MLAVVALSRLAMAVVIRHSIGCAGGGGAGARLTVGMSWADLSYNETLVTILKEEHLSAHDVAKGDLSLDSEAS